MKNNAQFIEKITGEIGYNIDLLNEAGIPKEEIFIQIPESFKTVLSVYASFVTGKYIKFKFEPKTLLFGVNSIYPSPTNEIIISCLRAPELGPEFVKRISLEPQPDFMSNKDGTWTITKDQFETYLASKNWSQQVKNMHRTEFKGIFKRVGGWIQYYN